jgi:trans-aconitate methyltransferase
MTRDTSSQSFFETMYRRDADPWAFASSKYEQSRYEAILQAIGQRQYQSAFEPGCSIGVLTERLAGICGHVQAMDISPSAVHRACIRCKDLPNVEITCGAIPQLLPSGPFDLVVFSEIGYYLEEYELQAVGSKLVERLLENGVFLAAHWLGNSTDHILSGDRVHEILGGTEQLFLEHSERHAQFRLDRWVRACVATAGTSRS